MGFIEALFAGTGLKVLDRHKRPVSRIVPPHELHVEGHVHLIQNNILPWRPEKYHVSVPQSLKVENARRVKFQGLAPLREVAGQKVDAHGVARAGVISVQVEWPATP